MASDYKGVAKKLGVRHLFGRWGLKLYDNFPDGNRRLSVRLIPLDGWIFASQEIIESLANDPNFSIKYGKDNNG